MNSKNKGNTFERQVSERLSLWLTKGKEKRACWRSDTSGAAATVWAKKGQEERYVQANAGDIRQIADKGLYPDLDLFFETFVIECKAYKEVDFYPPFNKQITTWLDQLIKEKETTGKKALLIVKANNRKVLFCQERTDQTPNDNPLFSLYYKGLTLDIHMFDEMVPLQNENRESGKSTQ
jgi:hypothetical protein